MGYDPTLEVEACDSCGQNRSVDLGYLTRNCTPMILRALDKANTLKRFEAGPGTLNGLTGMSGQAVVGYVGSAIEWWAANPDSMADLEPENGFGNSNHALQWWIRLVASCNQYPEGIMRMYG